MGAQVIAHENVLNRMSASVTGQVPFALRCVADGDLSPPQADMFFNGEAVQIIYQPAAHTDGDSIVFFRRSDVVSSGEIFTCPPIIR